MKTRVFLAIISLLFLTQYISAEMYLDSNGNIGIGTTAPGNKLTVDGTIESKTGGIKFPDGTTQTTAAAGGGSGDITAVNAGTGLTGGAVSGDATLNANTTYLQRRVSSTCSSGSSIRIINTDGTVVCETDNGSGGITEELDPTVPDSVKDGVDWTEVIGRPVGLDDGDDVGITSETDPEIGNNITDYVPKWNGGALVTGTIFDDGNIGIGKTDTLAKLDVYSPIGNHDIWLADAYLLWLESGSIANPLHSIQVIKSYGPRESEIRFDNGNDMLGAIYTISDDRVLNFLVGGLVDGGQYGLVTFENTNSAGDLKMYLRASSTNESALVFDNDVGPGWWEDLTPEYASKIYRPANSQDLVVNVSGIGDVMTFDSGTGNVGIGTASPQSSLQVDGYVQLALTSGSPPSSDCDEVSERGRMKIDNSAGLLFICADSGWITK
jgi:hypothetical protein